MRKYMKYKDYLRSTLWRKIRSRVMQRDDYRCRSCGKRATQVHHMKYDQATMAGRELRWLLSLCGPCHEATTFDAVGRTRPMSEVLAWGMALLPTGTVNQGTRRKKKRRNRGGKSKRRERAFSQDMRPRVRILDIKSLAAKYDASRE